MNFRTIIFWLHLSLGLLLSLFVLLMAGSGSLLVFEHPLKAWADRPWSHLKEAPTGPRLSLDALAQAARQAQPEPALSILTLRQDPQAAAFLQFGREKSLYLDPYSGAVLGEGSVKTRDFFKSVEGLHRWFGIEGKSKEMARQVKYACNLAFLFLIVGGLYLWWPKKLLAPKLRLKGKQRDFNWHNALGFLAWPFIFTVSLTGLVMSYPWASDLLYKATGNEAPARPAPRVEAKAPTQSPKKEEKPALKGAALEAYFRTAHAQLADWKVMTLRLPQGFGLSVNVTLQSADNVLPSSRHTLILNAATAAVEKWEPYQGQNGGKRLKAWARWIHTGEAAGWPGQILAFLTCLVLITLVYTGLALSWRRFFSRT